MEDNCRTGGGSDSECKDIGCVLAARLVGQVAGSVGSISGQWVRIGHLGRREMVVYLRGVVVVAAGHGGRWFRKESMW